MEINSSNNNIKNDLIPNKDEKNEELKDKIDNNTSPQNILNEEIKDDLSNKNDSFEIENKDKFIEDNKHFQTKSNTDIEYILNNNIENEINQNKNKASSLFSNSDYQYVSELNKLDFMETNTEEFKPYV